MTKYFNQIIAKRVLNRFCLALILLFSSLGGALADTDYQSLLLEADELRSSDPTTFFKLVDELNEHQEQLSPYQRDFLKYLTAYSLGFKGKLEQSIALNKELIDTSLDLSLVFRAYSSLLTVYGVSQNWTLGLETLNKIFELQDTVSNPKLKQDGLFLAFIFYNQLGQFEEGLKYGSRIKEEKLTPRNLCSLKHITIEARSYLGTISHDDAIINQGLEACKVANEPIMSNFIRVHISKMYLKEKDILHAEEMLLNNLSEIEQTKYPRLIVEVYELLSEINEFKGDKKIAENFAKKTIQIGKNISTTLAVVKSYKQLYELAKQKGDLQEALKYHELYSEADKAYIDDVKAKTLAYQLAQHNAIQQQNEIELLNRQNALLQATQQLSREEAKNLKLVSAFSIVVTFFIGLFGYRSWCTQKRLKVLAEYDSLTRVYNRRHYTELAEEAIKLCANKGQNVSCVLLDLDHFKKVNDTYGHAVGDWVLQRVAEAVSTVIRTNDIFARLGGEEFAILLPGCDVDNALRVVEKCRQAIELIDTSATGNNFDVSASFGLTDSNRSGYKLDQLFTDADSAAYESKDKGRNQVTVFSPA